MQSFAYKVKSELCRQPVSRQCCARAEAYGVLLFCNTFTAAEVRIITENPEFAARLPRLFQRAFSLKFDSLPDGTRDKLIFRITQRHKLARIVDLLGFSPEQNLALHINFGLLEEECCRASFLRGVFFAGGSVTDPAKRYHLELSTPHLSVSRELRALLLECGFTPKETTRKANSITYFKQSEAIEDFLTAIGAPLAAMEIMNAKAEKDLRGSINRRVNCDAANLDKAVDAAQGQIEAIYRLEERGMLEELPDKLKEAVDLRVAHPELTLAQLAELCEPPVSKSAFNHRLRKLMEMARA